jgi:aminoglycoside 6'-N-acetyltransferase I
MAEIRRLGEADRATWAAMRAALWPDDDAGELAHDLPEFLADPRQAAFGAFDRQEMVGFAECSERAWGDGTLTRPVGWLEGIYVVPDRRRTGIAAALVAEVEAWCRARSLSELGSDALADNHASIAAHASWGFEQTERLVLFRKALK